MGFEAVDEGVVGWISGGEPVDGCQVVSLMILAPTEADVLVRAHEIGLWSPYVMDFVSELDRGGVAAAVADPEGFVWNYGRGDAWQPSSALPRPIR